MTKLVAYFSATGTTKNAAEYLASATNSDLFEIEPSVPYTNADLNWMDKKSRSSVEMEDESSRPEIAKKLENMSDYDTIYICFPIWWYREPSIIDTFLESYDFTGKKIVIFATSGSSRLGKSAKHMEGIVSVPVEDGCMLNGNVQSLNLDKYK